MCYFQDNNVTLWKIPNSSLKVTDSEEIFEENDPVAQCVDEFPGSVTDIKVSLF